MRVERIASGLSFVIPDSPAGQRAVWVLTRIVVLDDKTAAKLTVPEQRQLGQGILHLPVNVLDDGDIAVVLVSCVLEVSVPLHGSTPREHFRESIRQRQRFVSPLGRILHHAAVHVDVNQFPVLAQHISIPVKDPSTLWPKNRLLDVVIRLAEHPVPEHVRPAGYIKGKAQDNYQQHGSNGAEGNQGYFQRFVHGHDFNVCIQYDTILYWTVITVNCSSVYGVPLISFVTSLSRSASGIRCPIISF